MDLLFNIFTTSNQSGDFTINGKSLPSFMPELNPILLINEMGSHEESILSFQQLRAGGCQHEDTVRHL